MSRTTLIFGIDVHKKRHFAKAMIKETRKVVSPILKIYNSKKGLDFLLQKASSLAKQYHSHQIIYTMEPTGVYWKPLAFALHDKDCIVHLVDPVQVKYKRKETDPANNKSDKIDPGLIAELTCDSKSNEARFMLGTYRLIQKTARNRRTLVEERASKKLRLQNVVYELCPELAFAFSDITGSLSSALLRKVPTVNLILSTPLKKLERIFKEYGNSKVKITPSKLKEQVSFSLGITHDNEAHVKQISMLLDQIELLDKQIAILDKDLEKYLKEIGETLTTMKGIGHVIASDVISVAGDMSCFTSGSQIVKLAGIDTVQSDSGEHKGRRYISKKGSAYLRTTSILGAISLIKHCEPFTQYYLYQTRVLGKKPMQAIIAVADKFLRICYFLLKDKVKFDPKKVGIGNLQTKAAHQGLKLAIDPKEILELDIDLAQIFTHNPKVVAFDEDDLTWVKIKLSSSVKTFNLQEPGQRVLALLNSL